MDKFKIIYNAITDIGKIIFKYKNQKITAETEDSICEMMVMELQQKKNEKYTDEKNGKLFDEIATTVLDFIFFKEETTK